MKITKIEMIGKIRGTDQEVQHYQSVPVGLDIGEYYDTLDRWGPIYDLKKLVVTHSEAKA